MMIWTAPVRAQAALDLLEMEALIRSGQAETAYARMRPYEFERAGDPRYDYLLGLAALESGAPDQATLAFERVLAVNPDMLGARLDMARAYFELGNDDLARAELAELQQMNPPPEAQQVISRYLSAIAARNSDDSKHLFAEFTIGHDSNINSAVGSSDLFVDALDATVTLDSDSVETGAGFFQLRLVGEAIHRLNKRAALFGGVELKTRSYDAEGDFNNKQGVVVGGVRYTFGDNTATAGVSYTASSLDGRSYRDVWGVNTGLSHKVNEQNTINVFAQFNQIRYEEEDDQSNDSDLLMVGAGWTTALDKEGETLLSTSVFAGKDDDQEGRIDGNREIIGVRVAAQHQLDDTKTLYGALGLQEHRYDLTNGLFLEKRKDTQFNSVLGMNWQYSRAWSVKPEIGYNKSSSNLDLYDYDQTEVGITVRRVLK